LRFFPLNLGDHPKVVDVIYLPAEFNHRNRLVTITLES